MWRHSYGDCAAPGSQPLAALLNLGSGRRRVRGSGLRPRAWIREKGPQEADRRQEGADLIDEAEAGAVGKGAEQRRADPAQAERQAEEKPGDRADIARRQLLRIDHDG